MDRKPFVGMLVAVIAAGFLGGIASERVFSAHNVSAQATQAVNIVSAEGFQLVDRAGTTRGLFMIGSDGNPTLRLLDGNGITRASLSLDDAGTPQLQLSDRENRLRSSLHLDGDGNPGMLYNDTRGITRAGLTVQGDGSPLFILANADGTAGAEVSLTAGHGAPVSASGEDQPGLSSASYSTQRVSPACFTSTRTVRTVSVSSWTRFRNLRCSSSIETKGNRAGSTLMRTVTHTSISRTGEQKPVRRCLFFHTAIRTSACSMSTARFAPRFR